MRPVKRAGRWWISIVEAGPYDSLEECEDGIRGLERFYADTKTEPAYFDLESPAMSQVQPERVIGKVERRMMLDELRSINRPWILLTDEERAERLRRSQEILSTLGMRYPDDMPVY